MGDCFVAALLAMTGMGDCFVAVLLAMTVLFVVNDRVAYGDLQKCYSSTMKLVIGLGNPEPEYSWTRHNIGKEAVNAYKKQSNPSADWQVHKKSNSQIVKHGNDYILAKPLDYMNESGYAVSKLSLYFDINPSNILIIYDELDFPVGEYKMVQGRGAIAHNGILSISQYVDTTQCWHLRIGVRDSSIPHSVQKEGKDPSKYVLKHMPRSDQNEVEKLIQEAVIPCITEWVE